MISLCPRHRAAKIFESDEGKYDQNQVGRLRCNKYLLSNKKALLQQPGSDEETEGESNSGPLAKLERTCYQFVDYKEIAKR